MPLIKGKFFHIIPTTYVPRRVRGIQMLLIKNKFLNIIPAGLRAATCSRHPENGQVKTPTSSIKQAGEAKAVSGLIEKEKLCAKASKACSYIWLSM